MYKKYLFLLFINVGLLIMANGTEETTGASNPEVSGKVFDSASGEPLVGATIYVVEKKRGAATNLNGEFSFKLPVGKYKLQVSFIGYSTKSIELNLQNDISLDIALVLDTETIDDVIVSAERNDINLTRTEMGVERMEMEQIKSIPTLMGETDVIKSIQLLPGVQATSEGSSGFSVRGGNFDQNLILFDQASVYNASHLLGFFSIFNNDAVENLELYKGDIPVMYGGRLSSLLDIKMKNGDSEKLHLTGGIGLISSRATFEGPLSENTTFLVSGRRSYFDLFFPLIPDEEIKDAKLNFWDVNGKLFHRINNKNTITFSGYIGRDVMEPGEFMVSKYGNKTATINYTHTAGDNFGTKLIAYVTEYDNTTTMEFTEESGFDWKSKMRDLCFRFDNTWTINNWNTLKFGISTTHHMFYPGVFKPTNSMSIYNKLELQHKQSLESGIYLSNEQTVTDKLTLRYGLRYSVFNNIGPETVYNFDEHHNNTDSIRYNSFNLFNTYTGWEPRVGAVYRIGHFSSVKASYARTVQYLHMASNSTGGTPYDIWITSNPNIKPQYCDQVSAGFFRNFLGNTIEASVELYYKNVQNSVDFKDFALLYFNEKMDGELRVGETKAYGAEFMVRLNMEKLNGWVSYTRSKTERIIPEINNGDPYRAGYDKPNDISIVLNYKLNKRIAFSLNWVYATGNPMTLEVANYWHGNEQIPIYSKRNAYRMPDYHRLDVAMTMQAKKNGNRTKLKRLEGEWNFSIYNLYNRHNAWTINFVKDEINPSQKYAEKIYLFPFMPSISYNFRF